MYQQNYVTLSFELGLEFCISTHLGFKEKKIAINHYRLEGHPLWVSHKQD